MGRYKTDVVEKANGNYDVYCRPKTGCGTSSDSIYRQTATSRNEIERIKEKLMEQAYAGE